MKINEIIVLSDDEIIQLYNEYIDTESISCGCYCPWYGLSEYSEVRYLTDCGVGSGCLSACQSRCSGHSCYCSGTRQPRCR